MKQSYQIGIKGFTLIELLVSTLIVGILLMISSKQLSNIAGKSYDLAIIRSAELQAENTLNLIGFDIRMLGTGIPFQQDDFEINDSGLSDITVSSPIDISSSSNKLISFKMDEDGDTYVLTSDFNPNISLSFSLDNVKDLKKNDIIYLSNAPLGKEQGLQAVIDEINGNTLTIKNNYISSSNLTFDDGILNFKTGSIVNEVTNIKFESLNNFGGITRSTSLGSVILASNAEFDLQYIADDGTVFETPLTYEELNDYDGNDLNRIRVTIYVKSKLKLKNIKKEEFYVAKVSQEFSIRNLNLVDF